MSEESLAERVFQGVMRRPEGMKSIEIADFKVMYAYAKGLEYGFNSIKNLAEAIDKSLSGRQIDRKETDR